MSNRELNFAALEECLQTLKHLFIDVKRLVPERRYKEMVGGYGSIQVSTLDPGTPGSKLVAAKKISLRAQLQEPKRIAFRLARELKVWAGLHHPHVLPLLGYYLDEEYRIAILISEYMVDGDLREYIERTSPSLVMRLNLIRDLTDGLSYLHGQEPPICHGDLKTGNVLVNPERRAVLADFGLSKALEEVPTGLTTSQGFKGTLRYCSPELVQETDTQQSLPSDIWAWACLALEVLTDKVPYAEKMHEHHIFVALLTNEPPSDAETLPIQAPALKQLLTHCWSIQPRERPSVKDCFRIINRELLAAGQHDGTGTDSAHISPLVDNQGSPMPIPSTAATNLPAPEENSFSPSPVSGSTPTGGANRRALLRRDALAVRPTPEDVFDLRQEFFPDHDLNKPVIDDVRPNRE